MALPRVGSAPRRCEQLAQDLRKSCVIVGELDSGGIRATRKTE